ncbi:unnamed protein product [Symbiodinium sp. CCMP2592]|nr:unnamed protein product [Symbiodinium sp. CCMP2592]
MGEFSRNNDSEAFLHVWNQVCEVVHFPAPLDIVPSLRIDGRFVPLRRIACVASPCPRCEDARGGFQFPWLGPWAVRATVVPDGWHPDDARTRFYECDTMFTDEELTLHGSAITMRDMLTATMARVLYMAEINTLHDLPGASLASVLDTWRQWQQGQRRWRDPSLGADEVPTAMEAFADPIVRHRRALIFWLFHAGNPEHDPGSLRAMWRLLLLVCCGTHFVGARQALPGDHYKQTEFEQQAVMVWCPPSSCSGSSFRFGLQLWAVGLALAIMPGNLGVYAAESLSAASAPESAYTAMGEMSRQRAGQWREQHGLLNDSDFAFTFQSYEEAMAQAGTLVAEEWAAVRAASSSGLYGAVTSALESATPSPQPAVRRHFIASVQCGQARGDLTAGLEREWRAALQRKAEAKARDSEAATVRGALLTFSELQIHMTDRGRAFPPDGVDLDAFLYGGTAAQSRALAGLRWLVKAGQLDHDLSAYDFRGQPNREPKQAAVAEPPMLEVLETKIEQLYNSNNPQWRALLGLWACCFGVLRLTHVNRSSPRRLSRSTFHFRCSKGKQKGHRQGFDYAISSYFMSGWDWSTRWLEDWRALPVLSREKAGINFNEFGKPYSTPQTVKLAQDVYTPLLGEGAAAVSTYSFRRVAPSYADTGWLDGAKMRQEGNSMPLRYASTRYTASVRRKHCLLNSVAGLVRFQSWDQVMAEALAAVERDGALGMDKAVQKDHHTVWQGQLSQKEVQSRFQLPAVVPVPAAARAMMPRQIGGKRLSATLRDGVQLCAAFQSGQCQHGGDECASGRHRCAILQSGRVCGGTQRSVAAPESPPRTGTRAKAAAVVLKPKAKAVQAIHVEPNKDFRCDLQLCWLTESLTSRGGAIIPGALQMQVAITDSQSRALVLALLTDVPFERAQATVGVQLWWVSAGPLRRNIFTDRSQVHLDLGHGDLQEAQGYQRAFCRDCLQRASAVFHPK